MSRLRDLYMITKKLYDHLQLPVPEVLDHRDQYIEKIDGALNERDKLLKDFHGIDATNESEQKIGRQMIKMNEAIQQKLQDVQHIIQTDMKQLQKKKQTGKRYENPYEGPTVDGIFFDKKK